MTVIGIVTNVNTIQPTYTGYELTNLGFLGYQYTGKTYTANIDTLKELMLEGRISEYVDGGITVDIGNGNAVIYKNVSIEELTNV